MTNQYALEWLESIVGVLLNPAKTSLDQIVPKQIDLIKTLVEKEKSIQHNYLNKIAFSLAEPARITLLIKQYQNAIVMLLDQAFENRKIIESSHPCLKGLFDDILNCLDELLNYIETRYASYLQGDLRVPVNYLLEIKMLLLKRLERLSNKLKRQPDKNLLPIVKQPFINFFDRTENNRSTTFQRVAYFKELIEDLEQVDLLINNDVLFSGLDKVLLASSFNSELYFYYLTQKISNKLNAIESVSGKMDFLYFNFKLFNQVIVKPGKILYRGLPSLKEIVENWFNQEILYYSHHSQDFVTPDNSKIPSAGKSLYKQSCIPKILCALSTDQTGLILRASDELRILKARSMNEVFKTIVPFLSTPYKANLSYDSMRSKSYAAEERDKKIAIDTLEQIIEKIKRY